MKEVFIFFITFFLFPIEKPLPSYFYILFLFFIFIKRKYKNYLMFFLIALLCKSSTLSYFPNKEIDFFEGKVLSFPYEGQYGISLVVKWKGYGIAPLNIQNYNERIPSLGSIIKVRAERVLVEKSPKPFSNKYSFILKIKDLSQIESKKINLISKIIYFPSNLNQKLYEDTKYILIDYPYLNSLIKSLIFARFSSENEEFFETFQMAGIVHILSISGLHIGIFLFYFLIFLRIFKIPVKAIYIFSIFFLAFYSSFCAFKAPVLRASIMVSLYFLFLLLHRPIDFEKTLILSLPLNALIMPNQIATPGFFLSYLSTYILIKAAPNFKNNFKALLFSSLYVQIFIQPFLLYSFGIINWQAMILNPLIIPFAFLFIFFSPLLLIFHFPFLLKTFNFLSYFIFELVQGTKNYLFWGAFLPYCPIIFVIFYYLITILYLEKNEINNKIGKNFFFFFFIFLSLYFLTLKKPENEISFLNVGQGSSILVKDNFENILIDTGKRSYFGWLLPSLLKENVHYLNLLILTHPDEDHIKWAEKIIGTIPVGGIAFPEIFKNDFKEIIKKAEKEKIKIFYLKRFNSFKTKNLSFETLSPEVKFYKDNNEGSLVLEILSKNKSFLLMADANNRIELEILSYLNKKPFALYVGHHGAKGSTSNKFLNCIDPKVAIISVGRRNPYNHPSKETIKNLNDKNILILRTDQRGTIKLKY